MLFVIATNAFALGLGVIVGCKMRGLIPLRSPSNTVRLENVKTDQEAILVRAQTEKDVAELERDRERAELEAEFVRAKARRAIRELEDDGTIVADDDVGVLIATMRGKKGLTQAAVCAGTRLTVRRLSAIEHGEPATLHEMRTLANYLGLDFIPATLRSIDKAVAHDARVLDDADVALRSFHREAVKELSP